ncbi:hypothetical protein GTA08_BOTSDO00972 [Neofusicoccum parvum]|nr:hypothetical protein GTA08_BOTSDO00972 [Neofusicoccum parvum]
MGLPVWRAPSPVDSRAQAVKNDASAAARSPIRRRSPASSRPGHISVRSDAHGHVRRDINVAELVARHNRRAQYASSLREAEARDQDRRNADLSSMANDDWLFDLDRLAALSSEARDSTHSPDEAEPHVHLYISTNGPSIRASRFGPNHPENNPFSRARSAAPERESSTGPDRPRARDSLERSRREPRSTPADALSAPGRRRAWPNRAQEPLGELPRHTYRRAPSNWSSTPDAADVDEDTTLTDATREFPPLRRMGRRQVTDGFLPSSSLRQSWSPSGAIDGLGDHTQLPSADSSFTSAAASASFSASTNNSQAGSDSSRADSTSSANTHVTIPSRRQSPDETSALLPQRACDTDDDMSGNDTESDETPRLNRMRAHNRRFPNPYSPAFRQARAQARAQAQDGPPTRNPAAYSSSVRSRSHDATAFVRNYYAFADRGPSVGRTSPSESSRSPPPSQLRFGILPRVPRLHREHSSGVERSVENRRDSGVGSDTNNSESGSRRPGEESFSSSAAVVRLLATVSPQSQGQLDPELESMRNILGRLARRDDVPEEFWISAGLVPPVLEAQRSRREQRERERL